MTEIRPSVDEGGSQAPAGSGEQPSQGAPTQQPSAKEQREAFMNEFIVQRQQQRLKDQADRNAHGDGLPLWDKATAEVANTVKGIGNVGAKTARGVHRALSRLAHHTSPDTAPATPPNPTTPTPIK